MDEVQVKVLGQGSSKTLNSLTEKDEYSLIESPLNAQSKVDVYKAVNISDRLINCGMFLQFNQHQVRKCMHVNLCITYQ